MSESTAEIDVLHSSRLGRHGQLAYLETNGGRGRVYTNSTPIGPLEIVATGAYPVDWAMGESTGPHTRKGRTRPEGEITDDDVWAKEYNIIVTERWKVAWSLGRRSGVLRTLRYHRGDRRLSGPSNSGGDPLVAP